MQCNGEWGFELGLGLKLRMWRRRKRWGERGCAFEGRGGKRMFRGGREVVWGKEEVMMWCRIGRVGSARRVSVAFWG